MPLKISAFPKCYLDQIAGARTMTVDEKTHNLITVTADFEPAPAPTPGQPRQRPKMIPDSFVVLVYGK